jgi:hypothetical protein
MTRVVLACLLSLLVTAASAQAPSPPSAAPAPTKAVAKKKPAAKPKAAATPIDAGNSGPYQVGIIAALDLFSVQKIGLTAFGNALDEVPVSWGMDDVVVARARAAAGSTPVRKITYAKGAFDSYYKREGGLGNLFRNYRGELTNTIRQIAGNAGCARYLVVMRGDGQFPGTNQPLTGVGVVHRGAGFIEYTFLFANLRIVIFDGQTFEIRQNPVTLDGVMQHLASSLLTNRDMDKIDNSAFPSVAADAAQSAVLRDGSRNLLARRLDKIFPAFFQP